MSIHNKLAAFLMCTSLLTSHALAAAPAAGDMAPDQFGKTIGGETPTLADFHGKVVVLTFWASWCGYCLKELPILESIQKIAKENVQVVAVNRQSRAEFRQIERNLSILTMKLTYDADDKGAKAYGVNGIPHLVIIGRDGKIIAVHRGYGEDALPGILAAINLAIAAPAPAHG